MLITCVFYLFFSYLVVFSNHDFRILRLFFLTKFFLSTFPFMEFANLDCKQDVSAGRKTLLSFSDGLGPSIFCRKMERTNPLRKDMDENFFSHWGRHSHFDVVFS